MTTNDTNKRRYERVYFPMEICVEGVVTFPGSQEESKTRILNMSQNGLCFVLNDSDAEKIGISDSIILKQLNGLEAFSLPREINVEVKWFMDHEMFDHVMFGGEFKDLTDREIDIFDTLLAAYSEK